MIAGLQLGHLLKMLPAHVHVLFFNGVWLTHSILCLDVHRSVQAHHGLVSECLQRGYVCIGGASGLSREGSVQVRANWTPWFPELGEGSGLATHSLQSGSQLPQKEDH